MFVYMQFVKPGSHLFCLCCVATGSIYEMIWTYVATQELQNFFYSCVAYVHPNYFICLPVATQHKQKDVNQALANGVCVYMCTCTCVYSCVSLSHLCCICILVLCLSEHVYYAADRQQLLCVIVCMWFCSADFFITVEKQTLTKCNKMQYYFVANKLD